MYYIQFFDKQYIQLSHRKFLSRINNINNMLGKILFGMIVFGIVTIIIGYLVGALLRKHDNSTIPQNCADWNKHHIMEKTLFITGALTWLCSYAYTQHSIY